MSWSNYPPNCYGPQYPHSSPVQFIPVPQGLDPLMVQKEIEKGIKKVEKKKRREQELADKKKKESAPKPIMFSPGQMLLILLAFGLPVGLAYSAAMKALLVAATLP